MAGNTDSVLRVSSPSLGGLVEWDLSEKKAISTGLGEPGERRELLADHVHSWRATIDPDDLPAVDSAVDELRDGRARLYRAHYRARTAGNRWTVVTDAGAPLSCGADGRPSRILIARAVVDPTDAGGRGTSPNPRALREYGHALNNHLTAVQGYAELLLDDTDSDHPFRTKLEKLCQASRTAALLVQQLMTLARQA